MAGVLVRVSRYTEATRDGAAGCSLASSSIGVSPSSSHANSPSSRRRAVRYFATSSLEPMARKCVGDAAARRRGRRGRRAPRRVGASAAPAARQIACAREQRGRHREELRADVHGAEEQRLALLELRAELHHRVEERARELARACARRSARAARAARTRRTAASGPSRASATGTTSRRTPPIFGSAGELRAERRLRVDDRRPRPRGACRPPRAR